MLRMQEPFTGGVDHGRRGGQQFRAAGRQGEYVMSACPPCGSDQIVSVGSLDPVGSGSGYRVSDFSNCGVEIAAPGRGIVSAAGGGGLKAQSGTSMAAPHVAGVAALWWQAVKQSELPANATLVRGKLLASAEQRIFAAVYPGERGAGRVAAPRDGVAIAPPRSTSRPRAEPLSPAELALAKAAIGAEFEPISIDARRVLSDWPGGDVSADLSRLGHALRG